jgi:hypothetical protein
MSIIKSGEKYTAKILNTMTFFCDSCKHSETVVGDDFISSKLCPKCKKEMCLTTWSSEESKNNN